MKILVCLPLALLAACSKDASQAADNTARNARDKGGETLTPMDQSESEGDVALTRDIRKKLVDDDVLSVSAENIKVITQQGRVTLRGVVASAAEKERVLSQVRSVPNVIAVDDQLEVKTN
jgi:hyperosmotically inducible periplasmic protein